MQEEVGTALLGRNFVLVLLLLLLAFRFLDYTLVLLWLGVTLVGSEHLCVVFRYIVT